ncbi:thiamine phosphate synthase [Campylobacter upsaliensis]|uniref:thiamine phosphate synthase n=1 Tax=Campylobacter upsaliensis TaxID=28080 RepID=UPI00126CA518|nr:thiamine phosphate synthase [Campylobacter upsaliensis]EAJ1957080.1 thiamine phosphate synthase [Campylobacter upsaliensis]EAJ7578868.1 thiamine phosphate synthase [Campylobacter upsaliensis]EAK9899810.1 thiamine phosphate synthase [Campylobacter upsaliensis]EAL3993331.1 thiamine phosphate synthase [Campylobacter upsaliensis]ECP5135663.1 thiamine phosphate synthase [Campylobacter upsaliensis]
MLDLSLYLVASRGNLSDEKFLNVLESAIKGGVSLIQLREKNLNARDFFALGLKAQKLCQKYKIPLIINDRIDLALALDADGVHLGQEDLPLQIARKILGKDKIIGLSLKSLKQLEGIEGADYLGCGAIKKTPTKESSVLSLELLSQICQNSSLPVVAIGGIDEAVIKDLRGIKLGGVAVVRAIMNAKNPYQAAKTLKKAVCENLSLK